MSDAVDLGPQSDRGSAFERRMRAHQSWWRAYVLRAGAGPGPSAGGDVYGSYLAPDAAEAGANFLSDEIFEVARERIAAGPGVERYRCLHNLLSSQPMCFNLFGPLVRDRDLAARLVDRIVPVTVSAVSDVRIEYAPTPADQYTGDRSSFDAFIEYVDQEGQRGFIGVETKLTERFSAKHYAKASRPRYGELTDAPGAPWRRDAAARVDEVAWNQLWRNHMLVEAVRKHPEVPHGAQGWLAVVHHPADPECTRAVAGYGELLTEPDVCLLDWSLERVAAAWRPAVEGTRHEQWLDAFHRRYVDMSASDGAWQELTGK